MTTKKKTTKSRRGKASTPAKPPKPEQNKYCIRITHHLSNTSKITAHHDTGTIEQVRGDLGHAMRAGEAFEADQGNEYPILLGISHDCVVEVMPFEMFVEEQAQQAAQQKRAQLG